jgi:chaperone BCS1
VQAQEDTLQDDEDPWNASNNAQGKDRSQSVNLKTPPKRTKVTLSGLLNAIDGPGSREGRLVIMTTNAPDALDEAMYRRGRIDRKFCLSYSTKRFASITFMRIFGRDPLNTIPEKQLINMSKRSGNRIPKDVFTPSDIQEFCLSYRGKPQEAVAGISEFV